jgi:hypothetical protein
MKGGTIATRRQEKGGGRREEKGLRLEQFRLISLVKRAKDTRSSLSISAP